MLNVETIHLSDGYRTVRGWCRCCGEEFLAFQIGRSIPEAIRQAEIEHRERFHPEMVEGVLTK